MVLETSRLILRPWKLEDAGRLYELAKDPRVGPSCGWDSHESEEESVDVLRDILINGYTFAICLKENEVIIGNIALMPFSESRFAKNNKQAEIGFWMGYPYWGNGYMTEACERVLCYGFEERRLEGIWCVHNVDNLASMRVQQKCGFKFQHTEEKYHLKINYISREKEDR